MMFYLMIVADALSRRDEELLTINALSSPNFDLFDDLLSELLTNTQARDIAA